MEWWKKYRPKKLEQIVGQPETVEILKKMFKENTVPQAILLHGSSGCGKTTIARIIRKKIGCEDGDFCEINAASERGIDGVRAIENSMAMSPMFGKSRVWLVDESHRLTPDAQSCLLKMLEDTPSHCYFMLCTTDPEKIINTVRTRCTKLELKKIPAKDMESLIISVIKKENKAVPVSSKVLGAIIEAADGSAREALVTLEKVCGLAKEEDQLNSIVSLNTKTKAIDLCRAIMKPGANWSAVAGIIKSIDDEPEKIRYAMLGYANTILLSGGKLAGRAYLVITAFGCNFYDSKMAGLTAACWEVVQDKS